MSQNKSPLEQLLENFFGTRQGNFDMAQFKEMLDSRGPSPTWRESTDPKVREIARLYQEMIEDIKNDKDPVSLDDEEGVAVMLGLGLAAMVVRREGAHLACLKELYLEFFRHIEGNVVMAMNMIGALERAERMERKEKGSETDWEGVIEKMGD